MAVLDSLQDLWVTVCDNGEALKEYDEDENLEIKVGNVGEFRAAKSVLKYVESISDK